MSQTRAGLENGFETPSLKKALKPSKVQILGFF